MRIQAGVLLVVGLLFGVASCQPQPQDFVDPADDPASPDYRLTAEHIPRYHHERLFETAENLPKAAPLQQEFRRPEEEVIIRTDDFADIQFIALVAGCSTLAAFLIVSTGYCVYRVHQSQRMTQDVDYPAYGVTGPVKNAMGSPPADRKLAQSAQMYHFQHQKQQMIAVEKNQQAIPAPANRRGSHSEGESDDEHEDKDYTVYECPGLAPGGQMEVRNPLFNDKKTSK